MKMAPDMKLLVNGDDSLSTFLAMDNDNPYTTYGISEQVYKEQDSREIREGRFCKRCGEKMEYKFYHYSQLGDYFCPKCGFARPTPEFDGSHIDMSDGLSFDVGDFHIKANYRGFTIYITYWQSTALPPWRVFPLTVLTGFWVTTRPSSEEMNFLKSAVRKSC